MKIESTFGNEKTDFHYHFQKIIESHHPIKKLGIRRFEVLRNALNPTRKELIKLVNILITASKR